MKLDALHQPMRDMFLAKLIAERDGLPRPYTDEQIDEALNKCGCEYCQQCGDVFCPWGESLHFHHDGCPCCTTQTDEQWENNKDERRRMLIARNSYETRTDET